MISALMGHLQPQYFEVDITPYTKKRPKAPSSTLKNIWDIEIIPMIELFMSLDEGEPKDALRLK